MPAEEILAEVAIKIPPHGMDVIGVVLGVVVFEEEGGTLHAVIVPLSWLVGLASGVVVGGAVGRASDHDGFLGPADLVTLTRATIACAVASLVAESWLGSPGVTGALVALAVAALVLDAVDGRVARATRPTSFGGRFDGEADAFLLLVLSVHVALAYGGWVLAIGLARYAFWAAGAVWCERLICRSDSRRSAVPHCDLLGLVAARREPLQLSAQLDHLADDDQRRGLDARGLGQRRQRLQ